MNEWKSKREESSDATKMEIYISAFYIYINGYTAIPNSPFSLSYFYWNCDIGRWDSYLFLFFSNIFSVVQFHWSFSKISNRTQNDATKFTGNPLQQRRYSPFSHIVCSISLCIVHWARDKAEKQNEWMQICRFSSNVYIQMSGSEFRLRNGLRHISHAFHKYPNNFHSIKFSSRSISFQSSRHVNVIAFHSDAHHIRYPFLVGRDGGYGRWDWASVRRPTISIDAKIDLLSIWSMDAASATENYGNTSFTQKRFFLLSFFFWGTIFWAHWIQRRDETDIIFIVMSWWLHHFRAIRPSVIDHWRRVT